MELNDVRQMLPWVLFEKLRPNPQSPFFEKDEHRVHLVDRATWIQSLLDLGVQQFAAYGGVRKQVDETIAEAADSTAPIARRMAAVERRLARLADDCELNAAVHADIVRLRSIYAGLCRLPGAAR